MSDASNTGISRDNKMGVMPIGKLLINMSLPIVLSALVQATYNVIDSILISRLGEHALTTISIAVPMQLLTFSVASGTGVGINALLARRLGEKKFGEANRIAQNGLLISVLSWVAFLIFGLFFSRQYYAVQTDIKDIVAMGEGYIRICMCCSVGMFVEIAHEKFLLSTGKTTLTFVSLSVSAVTKIIFDPLLIFGYLGFPALGIIGGAVSTIIGQLSGAATAVILNAKFNKEVSLGEKNFRPDGKIIKEIYKIGAPSIVMSSVGSVLTFGMNRLFLSYTSTATAVYGTYFRLQSFFVQPIMAINNGVVSIVSYNYGAKKRERVVKTIRLSIIAAVAMLMCSFTVMQTMPDKLLSLFEASDEMLRIGMIAFRRITFSYIFGGPVIILSAVFQALGRSFVSLTVALVRQLLVLLPCAYLFSWIWGLDAVWWAYPVAEMTAFILVIIFFRQTYRKTISAIPSENDQADSKRGAVGTV